VKCMASELVNIHEDKRELDIHYVERKGTVGDYYDAAKDAWTPMPENYPKPNTTEIEQMILSLIRKKSDVEQLEILLDTDKRSDKDDIDKKVADLKKLYKKVK